MNRFEKIAWYNLVVVLASTLLFLAVFFSIRSSFPLNISLKISFSAFGLLGFLGLWPTLFKKMPGIDNYAINNGISNLYGAEFDERDMLIGRRAFSHGFGAFWLVLVFSVMITWVFLRFIRGGGSDAAQMFVTIDVDLMPLILIPGLIIIMLARSLSTIFQYRSIGFGDNSDEIGAGPGRKTIAYTLAFLVCFITFSFFLVSLADWNFAVSFLMLTFAAAHVSIRTLRYSQSGSFTLGDFRLLKIVELTTRVLFSMFYLASITSIVLLYLKSRMVSLILPRLVVLGFGALIFTLSILKYGHKPQMENRHEKA
ncbi:hypothetical protein ACFL6K_05145 [Candidatus Latescibacterota bacterium]